MKDLDLELAASERDAPRVTEDDLAALMPIKSRQLFYRSPGLPNVFMLSRFLAKPRHAAKSDRAGLHAFGSPGSAKAATAPWSFVLIATVQAARTSDQYRSDLLELLNAPADGSRDREILQRFLDRAVAEVREERARKAAATVTP